MAVSPTPPSISVLPPAPLPTDAEAVFDAKAGVRLTAEEVMVTEQNAVLAWQADSMAETKGYKDAAATFAGNAADSASSAATVGGQAVTAAQAARDAAAASALSAQASAEAAGASANFPTFVDPLDVLMVNQTKTGVKWGKVGQAVGDVLETTRTPDATYVLPDTIYSRAAYPELFAIVGTQGEKNDGANFVTRSSGFTGSDTMYAHAIGKNGLIIAVGGTTSSFSPTNSKATKSIDGGVTWTDLVALAGMFTLVSIAADDNGVWIALGVNSNNQTTTYTSTDNGVTWTTTSAIFGGTAGNSAFIRTDKKGNWVCWHTGSVAYRSADNGANWTAITIGAGVYDMSTDSSGNWYYVVSTAAAGAGSNIVVHRAVVLSSGFYPVFSAWDITGLANQLKHGNGVSAVLINYVLYVSVDAGLTWIPKTVTSTSLAVLNTGEIFLGRAASGKIIKSIDAGETWKDGTFHAAQFLQGVMDSQGNWVTRSGSTIYSSSRQYNYDVTTQFKTPARKAPKGFKAYIKGKL